MLSKVNLLDERWVVFRDRVNPTEFYRRLSCCLIVLLLVTCLFIVGILSMLYKNFNYSEADVVEPGTNVPKKHSLASEKYMRMREKLLSDMNRTGNKEMREIIDRNSTNIPRIKQDIVNSTDNRSKGRALAIKQTTEIISVFEGSANSTTTTLPRNENFITVEVVEDCPEYFWGTNCKQPCDCSGSKCDPVKGTCFCASGKTGPKCQTDCPANSWGVGCIPCNCTVGQICDKMTGKCSCMLGKMGPHCDIPDRPVRLPTRGDVAI